MKKLVLAASLAAAVSATACTTSSKLSVTADWTFKHVADGTARSCPVNFDTATVLAVPYDTLTAEVNGGLIRADLFDCDRGSGTVLVPDGQYLMSVRIEDHAGVTTYADSEQVFVDTAFTDGFDVEILDDGGYMTFRWTLHDSLTDQRISCADARISPSKGAVESVATSVSNPNRVVTDKFTCDDHYGTTAGLLAGSYTVSVEATENDIQVGDPVNMASVPVVAPNHVTDLGHLKIPVDR